MATAATGESLRVVRAIGFVTSLPVFVRPPSAKAAGAWIVTSSAFVGTRRVVLQLGHGPDLPANLSLTLKLFRHSVQTTMIDMRRLVGPKGDSPIFADTRQSGTPSFAHPCRLSRSRFRTIACPRRGGEVRSI